jgi:hypothetical protein
VALHKRIFGMMFGVIGLLISLYGQESIGQIVIRTDSQHFEACHCILSASATSFKTNYSPAVAAKVFTLSWGKKAVQFFFFFSFFFNERL